MAYYYVVPLYLTAVLFFCYWCVRGILRVFDWFNFFWDRWDQWRARVPSVFGLLEIAILLGLILYIVKYELQGMT